MYSRCAARPPRLSLPAASYLRNSVQPLPWRSLSSHSNASRKLPGSNSSPRLQLWQRTFLIGTVAGLIFGNGVWYFQDKSVKDSFITYKLVGKESVSSNAAIFHLEPNVESEVFEKYKEVWRKGIWNVQFKQPQIQIVRAYTPLPPNIEDGKAKSERLRFLIRYDPQGEVSSYLHRLPVGADIELRGPNLEYELTPEVQQVVFFAGGTGIAPALQIAHAMFEGNSTSQNNTATPEKTRKLHILWASRRREDCLGGVSDAPVAERMPPKATWSGLFTKHREKPVIEIGEEKGPIVQELEELKRRYPGQITVEYFVNAEGTWIDEDVVFRSLSRFDDKDFSTGYATPQEQRQVLISGPSGFINYLAGPKEWKYGREEQGPVGKIIAHAIAQNPHHVKVWKI